MQTVLLFFVTINAEWLIMLSGSFASNRYLSIAFAELKRLFLKGKVSCTLPHLLLLTLFFPSTFSPSPTSTVYAWAELLSNLHEPKHWQCYLLGNGEESGRTATLSYFCPFLPTHSCIFMSFFSYRQE